MELDLDLDMDLDLDLDLGFGPKGTKKRKNLKPLELGGKPIETEKEFAEDVATATEWKATLKKRDTAMKDMTQAMYYVNLIFQNDAQRDEFLKKSGWAKLIDDEVYMDGMALAELLGIELKTEYKTTVKSEPVNRFGALAFDLDELYSR